MLPALGPNRRRSEIATWVRDDGVSGYLEERLARHRYVSLREYPVYGADAQAPRADDRVDATPARRG